MNNKCKHCGLINFHNAEVCLRCGRNLHAGDPAFFSKIIKRFAVLVAVCAIAIAGFYGSLLYSADPLAASERQMVADAITLLRQRGFGNEALLLRHVAAYRANDNWLNASVEKENAYAATNFPFEIVTIYPEFFTRPIDDTERAAILLHEARHLQGKDEHDAYEFVWKNRTRLGWTQETHGRSEVWLNVRKQTREYLPAMFICDFNEFGDCTQ